MDKKSQIWRKQPKTNIYIILLIFMKTNKKNEKEIGIRLNLNSKEDKIIYDYFLQIKNNLGVKTNTEVARICIKKAYEYWFKEIIKEESNMK